MIGLEGIFISGKKGGWGRSTRPGAASQVSSGRSPRLPSGVFW
jgi:hypothetical protein